MSSNKTDLQSIGDRISKLRQLRGLTQKELADILHVGRETVSYWETGARDLKSEQIVFLSDVLNTDCDYLLRGVTSKNVDINRSLGLDNDTVEMLDFFNSQGLSREVNFLLSKSIVLLEGFSSLRKKTQCLCIDMEEKELLEGGSFFSSENFIQKEIYDLMKAVLRLDVRSPIQEDFLSRYKKRYEEFNKAQDALNSEIYKLSRYTVELAEYLCDSELKKYQKDGVSTDET